MPHINVKRRSAILAAGLLTLLAALTLAACGGSSKGASSTAAANAAQGRRGQFKAREAALRACLHKSGIALPKRSPGQSRTGAGGPLALGGQGGPPGTGANGPAAAPQLPKGVTRTQLQAALKKCGGGALGRVPDAAASASRRQGLAKFAACMRAEGVKLPAANTSGKGPIFDTKAIDTNSATFKAADVKCARELAPSRGGAGVPPGVGGSPPGSGGPPGALQP